MITKVHMEALSPTMEEGQLVRWHKTEGDPVTSGDVLAEIETDKATMELVARGDGTLRKVLLGEGGTAPVGDVIAVIAGADEDISGIVAGEGGAVPSAGKDSVAQGETPAADGPGEATKEPVSPPAGAAPAPGGGQRIKASPLARRLAEDLGVDLSAVAGSGPGGRIVKRDVEAAKEAAGAAAPPAAAWTPDEAEHEDVPVSQMRKTIAKRLVESIGPVPHGPRDGGA
jgi:pyruvate dehydrogenase E2 component (dihydrolipoamide acetyltransferase)